MTDRPGFRDQRGRLAKSRGQDDEGSGSEHGGHSSTKDASFLEFRTEMLESIIRIAIRPASKILRKSARLNGEATMHRNRHD
jgi:hypothetical protein